MSLPSDNENFKKEEEESVSNGDGSSDGSIDIGQDGKKRKRRTKKASKLADVAADIKIGQKTRKSSKTGKSGNSSKDADCAGGDSDSTSGEKNVGEVRDDIEHLKLSEEMAKASETKLLESTGQLQTRPDISLGSQPEVPVPGPSKEKVPPPTEHLLKTKVKPCDKGDTEENPQDLNKIRSTSKAGLRRAAYAQNAENTLDDISEITSDVSDLQSDSSSGRQTAGQSAREGTPSLDAINESTISVFKTVKSAGQDKDVQAPNIKVSRLQDVDSTSSTSDDQSGSSARGNVEEKGNSSKSDNVDEENVSDQGVDRREKHFSNREELQHDIHMEDKSGSGMEVGDLVRDQNENAEDQARKDAQKFSGSKNKEHQEGLSDPVLGAHGLDEQSNVHVIDPDKVMEECEGQPEMDNSVSNQDNSGAQGGSDEQRSGMEHMIDPDVSGHQGSSDDQSNMINEEAAGGLEAAGGQDVIEQENDDFENFAAGNYVGYRVDSTPTNSDSGIENSDAVFGPTDNRRNEFAQYEVPAAFQESSDNSSSLATSGRSGLNNLQQWVGAGDNANAPEPVLLDVHPNQPMQASEKPNLNVPVDQPVPSTSSDNQSDWPGPGVVNVAEQQISTVPMECVEHCTSETNDGNEVERQMGESVNANLESNPSNLNLEARSTGAEGVLGPNPISSGANLAQENIPDDLENANTNQEDEESSKKDDLEQLSTSSMEESLDNSLADMDNSLADMDDAVDTSEYSKSDGNVQLPSSFKPLSKPSESERPLRVGPTTAEGCAKEKVEKKRSQKRLAKVTPENKSKKKRKGVNIPCRLQNLINIDTVMQTSSSEESA